MADKKISQLTAATAPLAGTEVLPIVQGTSTVKVANNDLRPKQIQSNATSGVLQIVGPAAAVTRVMTTPDTDFTVARTDAAQSFSGDQTLSTGNLVIGTAGKGIYWQDNDLNLTSQTASAPVVALRGQGTYAGIHRIYNADNSAVVTAIAGLANSDSFINNGGNFGLGTASPFAVNGKNFDIVASDYARLHLASTGGSGRRYWMASQDDGNFYITDGSASANRVQMDSSGNVTLKNAGQYFGMSQFTKKKWIQFAYPGAGKFGADNDCTDFFVAGSDNDLTRARLTAGGNWGLIGASFNGQTLNDYAEYFEWLDGNPNNEDRIGMSVVLRANKIAIATTDDDPKNIIGAVSGNAGTVHGAAMFEWGEKYLKDDYGRTKTVPVRRVSWTERIERTRPPRFDGDPEATYIEEKHHNYDEVDLPADVVVPEDAFWRTHNVPIENPNYDPSREYTSRTERPEWACIGIMGQVRIRKGSPIGERWIWMRDISNTVSEWLVR